MHEVKIGKVVHYFDNIGVVAIDLTGDLAVGDTVKFVKGGEVVLEQQVGSMQIEHDQVESATAEQSVGMKTTEKVREGAEVYRVLPD